MKNITVFKNDREIGLVFEAEMDLPLPLYVLKGEDGQELFPLWTNGKYEIDQAQLVCGCDEINVSSPSSQFIKRYRQLQSPRHDGLTLSYPETRFLKKSKVTFICCPFCHKSAYFDSFLKQDPYIDRGIFSDYKKARNDYPHNWRGFAAVDFGKPYFSDSGEYITLKNSTGFFCPHCGEEFKKIQCVPHSKMIPSSTMILNEGEKVIVSSFINEYHEITVSNKTFLKKSSFISRIVFNKKSGQTTVLPFISCKSKKKKKSWGSTKMIRATYKGIANAFYSRGFQARDCMLVSKDVADCCFKEISGFPCESTDMLGIDLCNILPLVNRLPMFPLKDIKKLSGESFYLQGRKKITEMFSKVTPQMTYEKAISMLKVKGPKKIIQPLIKRNILNAFKINEFYRMGFTDESLIQDFCSTINDDYDLPNMWAQRGSLAIYSFFKNLNSYRLETDTISLIKSNCIMEISSAASDFLNVSFLKDEDADISKVLSKGNLREMRNVFSDKLHKIYTILDTGTLKINYSPEEAKKYSGKFENIDFDLFPDTKTASVIMNKNIFGYWGRQKIFDLLTKQMFCGIACDENSNILFCFQVKKKKCEIYFSSDINEDQKKISLSAIEKWSSEKKLKVLEVLDVNNPSYCPF